MQLHSCADKIANIGKLIATAARFSSKMSVQVGTSAKIECGTVVIVAFEIKESLSIGFIKLKSQSFILLPPTRNFVAVLIKRLVSTWARFSNLL